MNNALAQSVKTRLVNHARKLGVDPNNVMLRYATERFLYRLSESPHADKFALKGAFMLLAWLGEAVRPTQDADLLRFGSVTDETLLELFGDICDMKVPDDAMNFDRSSIAIRQIREEDEYGGRRMTLRANLGNARFRIQIDIGIGDTVVPEAEWYDYPSLLDLPSPRLKAYSPITSIAEKAHAMETLGAGNTRMKDFFDVWLLSRRLELDGSLLVAALQATFARRGTVVRGELPLALTAAFPQVEGKQAQWAGFLNKNILTSAPEGLGAVIEDIAEFLGPVFRAGALGTQPPGSWSPGGPWND